MKGIIFLDKDFKEVPTSDYTMNDWDLFIQKTDYIFIDTADALNKWNEMYSLYECKLPFESTPFDKVGTYMFMHDSDEWVLLERRISELRDVIHKISRLYISTKSILPLSEEENNL